MKNASKYQLNADTLDDLRKKRIHDLTGDELKESAKNQAETLKNLIEGDFRDAINKRGFVVTIDGAWGAGKSTTAWAVINEIKNNVRVKPMVIDRQLLPFGNVSESISLFLNELSDKLCENNLINISSEINQFILESSPLNEGFNVAANLGFFSLSKK